MPSICKTCTYYKGVVVKNEVDKYGSVRSVRQGLKCGHTDTVVPEYLESCGMYEGKSDFVENVENENGVRIHYAD